MFSLGEFQFAIEKTGHFRLIKLQENSTCDYVDCSKISKLLNRYNSFWIGKRTKHSSGDSFLEFHYVSPCQSHGPLGPSRRCSLVLWSHANVNPRFTNVTLSKIHLQETPLIDVLSNDIKAKRICIKASRLRASPSPPSKSPMHATFFPRHQ